MELEGGISVFIVLTLQAKECYDGCILLTFSSRIGDCVNALTNANFAIEHCLACVGFGGSIKEQV